MCKEPATPLLLLFSLIKYLSLGTHQNIFCLLAYFASELHTAHTQQNMSVNLTDSFSDSIVFIISIPPVCVCVVVIVHLCFSSFKLQIQNSNKKVYRDKYIMFGMSVSSKLLYYYYYYSSYYRKMLAFDIYFIETLLERDRENSNCV